MFLCDNQCDNHCIFSREVKKTTHLPLVFNNANVSQTNSQKHLGVTLYLKINI